MHKPLWATAAALIISTGDMPSSAAAPPADGNAMPRANVTLLDAGTGKKAKLRLRPKKSVRQTVTMVLDSTVGIEMDGMPAQAGKTPQIRTKVHVQVTEVRDNGDIRYEFSFGKGQIVQQPGMPFGMVEAMKAPLEQLQGLTGFAVVTDTGQSLAGKIHVPKGASPQLAQLVDGFQRSITQLSAPFPREAVGRGARWRVDMPIAMNGIRMVQSATYKLESKKKNIGKLSAVITHSAKTGPITPPGMPPSMKAELVSMTGTGSARIEFDLTKLVPKRSKVDGKNEMTVSIATPPLEGKRMTMRNEMSVEMTAE